MAFDPLNTNKDKQKDNRNHDSLTEPTDTSTNTSTDTNTTTDNNTATSMRLAKAIAKAGITSRRGAEKLILSGDVVVNNKIITTPALNVSPSDEVLVNGVKISLEDKKLRVWLYNKPSGLITSHKDEKNRPTVFESLPKDIGRVISVGRLDFNSEGLLLLTNNGEFSRLLELPTTGWIRRYKVRAIGLLTDNKIQKLKKGVFVDGVKYGAIIVHKSKENPDKPQTGKNSWFEVSLKEGKNREVRKALGSVGLTVNRLVRISYGSFLLGNLQKGEVLEVTKRSIINSLKRENLNKFNI